MASCTARTRIDYRSAPLLLLERSDLSADSKVLATWVLMHGNGWEFRIAFALRQTKISLSRWERRVRKELLEAGFFHQVRRVGTENGRPRIFWENVLTNEPLASIHLYPQFAGIQTEGLQDVDATKSRLNKIKKQQQAQAPAPSLDEVVNALFWDASRSSLPIRRRGAWEAKVRRELQRGIAEADLAVVEEFRAHHRRLSALNVAPAVLRDPAALERGQSLLDAIEQSRQQKKQASLHVATLHGR